MSVRNSPTAAPINRLWNVSDLALYLGASEQDALHISQRCGFPRPVPLGGAHEPLWHGPTVDTYVAELSTPLQAGESLRTSSPPPISAGKARQAAGVQ